MTNARQPARRAPAERRLYERFNSRPLPFSQFLRRVARHLAFAVAIVVVSLGAGMAGYHRFEGLSWLDAFLNASMLLGGMGPVDTLRTPEGKLFAGFFALYAGLVFLIVAGIVFAPAVHRLMHKFHWREEEPS